MVPKHFYEAPESELILVKFEGNFCATDGYGDSGMPGGYNPYAPGDGSDIN